MGIYNMSGVCGSGKIQSRQNFDIILKEVNNLIQGFNGYKSISPTGSYNSNLNKTQFGDMDLITFIDGSIYGYDKKLIKKELANYFIHKSHNTVTKFTSEKHKGRRYYNSGEIITIAFKSKYSGIDVAQIDFIIAMDETETKFKLDFLDMPAQKQGLILGLVKTALIEEDPNIIFYCMGIDENTTSLKLDQEYEFNLSSTELQLRKVTYHTGTLKQKNREILWKSRNWDNLRDILSGFDLDNSFENIITQATTQLKNPRSYRRIEGVFNSMITIKSGEVGKNKGETKQKALDLIHNVFGE